MVDYVLSQYGAMGNGIDDDTYAVMLSFERQGKAVLEPGKTYKTTMALLTDGCDIIGAEGAKIICYNDEQPGIIHTGGVTRLIDVELQGLHDNPVNEIFGVTSDAQALGSIEIHNSAIHGFTNGVKFDEYLTNSIINNLHIYNLKGNKSGQGYGVLCADGFFNINNLNVSGDRANGNGRHGLYLSATARNGNVSNVNVSNMHWEGITLFAYAYQNGVRDIRISDVIVDNCAHNASHGALSVFGNVQDVEIIRPIVTNSYGSGIMVDSYRMDMLQNINFYKPTVSNSQYIGMWLKGAQYCEVYNPVISDSSLAAPQVYSNLTVMTDYEVNNDGFYRVAKGLNFYNVESACSANTSKSPAQINQSTPLPEDINFFGCEWDNTNFLTGPEYI